MTAPVRAHITRQPNLELPFAYGVSVVIQMGWRYEIRDSGRRPGLDLLAAEVKKSQPDALEAACRQLKEWNQ